MLPHFVVQTVCGNDGIIRLGRRRCACHAARFCSEARRAGGFDGELDVWERGGAEVSLLYAVASTKSESKSGEMDANGDCSCLRNVVTLFQYIEKEKAWRREKGRPEGFEALEGRKPIGGFERLGGCGW